MKSNEWAYHSYIHTKAREEALSETDPARRKELEGFAHDAWQKMKDAKRKIVYVLERHHGYITAGPEDNPGTFKDPGLPGFDFMEEIIQLGPSINHAKQASDFVGCGSRAANNLRGHLARAGSALMMHGHREVAEAFGSPSVSISNDGRITYNPMVVRIRLDYY